MYFRVHCSYYDILALNAAARVAARRTYDWKASWEERIEQARLTGGYNPVELDRLRQEQQAERIRLVAQRKLTFSRADLLRQALDQLIEDQGWGTLDSETGRWLPDGWEELPVGAHRGPGRRHASTNQNWDTDIHYEVRPDQGELIRRVAYWSSLEPMDAYLKWRQTWGRGPAAAADAHPAVQGLVYMLAMLNRPHADAMKEKNELQQKIIHPADILRSALWRAGNGFGPEVADYKAWLEERTPGQEPDVRGYPKWLAARRAAAGPIDPVEEKLVDAGRPSSDRERPPF